MTIKRYYAITKLICIKFRRLDVVTFRGIKLFNKYCVNVTNQEIDTQR